MNVFETAVIAGYFEGFKKSKNGALGQKTLFLDGHYLHDRLKGDNMNRKSLSENIHKHTRFQDYMDAIDTLIIDLNPQGVIRYANKYACEILGFQESEILNKNWFDAFIPRRMRGEVRKIFCKMINGELTGFKQTDGCPVLTWSGEEKIIALNYSVLKDRDDNIVGVISSGTDVPDPETVKKGLIQKIGMMINISDRKIMEENLKPSEKMFRTFFENIPVGSMLAKNRNEPLKVNQTVCDMLGYTKEELEGRPTEKVITMISYPEDLRKEIMYAEKIKTGKIDSYRMEKRYIKKNGDIIYCDVSTTYTRDNQGNLEYCMSSIIDITSQKKAQQALKESRERYSALFDRSFDCIYLHDLEGNYLDGNKAVLELTGYSKEEITQLNVSKLSDQDQEALVKESMNNIIRNGSEEKLNSYKIKTKNNEYRHIETRGSLICKDGKPYAIQGVARDVTEQKKAGDALKENELKFRTLFNASPQPISLISLETLKFMDVNEKYCEVTGCAKDQIIGETYDKIVSFVSEEQGDLFYNQLIENNKVDAMSCDLRVITGEIKTGLLYASIVNIKDKPCIMGLFVDLTKMKYLESRLHEAQKLEAIGTLSGGIAHDFNNMLGVIMGNAEFLKLSIKEDNKAQRYVDQILEESLRGERVVRQLLDFSHQTEKIKLPLMLKPLIEDSIEFIKPLIPANIEIRRKYSDDTHMALVDTTQLQQVIINLCTNAYQAMSGKKGIIDIIHDTVTISETCVDQFNDLKTGRYIRLRISDNGKGIPPKNLDRIFEPYFTTKGPGNGTGLGLSVVHGIIQDCSGSINVQSEPRKGTTFTILLPVAYV